MKTGLKNCLVTVIMALMSLLGFSVMWCLRTFGRLSMEELVYELSAPLEGTGSDMISRYIVGALVPTIVMVAAILFFGIIRKKNLVLIYGLIASIIFAVTSSAVFFKRLNVYDYLVNSGDESKFIENNYVDPGNVNITFPEKK
ncbi:MAG: phosphoglycerol transferase, partial [Butyrivibrio sp.]|nr:phosphoglycerol transferase [Butyrivibrio sp.]